MNKETIRPLLVAAVEHAQDEESHVLAHYPLPHQVGRAAQLKRVQAEVQLWLADRQWEREA